jgi:hypothetical protein
MVYVGVDISSEKFDVAFYYPQKINTSCKPFDNQRTDSRNSPQN